MDVRRAFLVAARTLFPGFQQLAHFRIVGNTAQIALIDIHSRSRDKYTNCELDAVVELKKIDAVAYQAFAALQDESTIVLAFSWLEAFLGDVEEAIFLTSPELLGEQVEVKLGKILSSKSVEELVHDIARKRVRQRSQWSLTNRLVELRDKHGFKFLFDEGTFDWVSELRNRIIHDRRYGAFKVEKRRVAFQEIKRARLPEQDVRRAMHCIANTVSDLYTFASRRLKISARMAHHKANKEAVEVWRGLWKPEQAKMPTRRRRVAS